MATNGVALRAWNCWKSEGGRVKAEESLGRAVDCPSSFAGYMQDIARRRAQTQHIFRLPPFSLATLNLTYPQR